jgi:hypothetical protein
VLKICDSYTGRPVIKKRLKDVRRGVGEKSQFQSSDPEKNFNANFKYTAAFTDLDRVKNLRSQFREQLDPDRESEVPDDPAEPVGSEVDEIMAMLAPIECEQGTIMVTGVAQQRSDFARDLERESDHTLAERLSTLSERGAYQLAKREIRAMASALGMSVDMVMDSTSSSSR